MANLLMSPIRVRAGCSCRLGVVLSYFGVGFRAALKASGSSAGKGAMV